MMSRAAFVLLAIGMTLAIAGCATMPDTGRHSHATPLASGPIGEARDLGDLIYLAATTLDQRAGLMAKDRPIVVATMVSIDNFDKSSTFGRLASQLISNRLVQRGYLVKDLTYMRALTVRSGTGELVLSEEASRMSASADAQAVVAGTYTVAGREIYLNIRMLSADTGEIISSADVVIPLDHNTETLVAATN